MSKKVELPNVWMIALGVFVVGFVLLMVVGYSFLAALVFALAVAVAVAVFLMLARGRDKDVGETRVTRNVAPEPRSTSTAAPLMSSSPTPTAAQSPAPKPPVKDPEPTPVGEASSPVAGATDTSGQVEPPRLDAAREGGPDDLKRIKGVGPKIETQLNSMGIYHLDQIAAWGPSEVAWMDENLEDFRGRVSRDDWVAQARLLAEGGDTEFSRRVDDGEVYD